ncbi:hypothetical protein QJS83_11305 [Bdellovibrio sp. 22V]|uniref:hypothetical protein n=1 Tax=Bdellovibrio TaxID=958 RepID=UPI0025430421|nr:hypothetical protein [Bdellovibrio sp. 22V]WII71048.1 hypothetical protein QJS83_11305 [Bdellovibrio sp. 22V]
MKKQVLVTVIAMIPAMSFAKVSDFNALITENVKAQNELHSTVKTNLNEARDAADASAMRERIVIVENSGTSYNATTKKDLLAFKKEKTHHRASEEKQFERLANEINSSDF